MIKEHPSLASFLAAATIGFSPAAPAQDYGEHTLSTAIDILPTPSEGQDGQRFTVPTTSTPAGPSAENGNTLIWAQFPPEDIDWLSGFQTDVPFQYLAFRSADASARNVFLAVWDEDQEFTTEYKPRLVVEHISLENVNVDPGPAKLAFDGTNFSWTMSNSRYSTADATPLFKKDVPLEMRSVAGTSALVFWNGEIGSPTTLVVDPGSTFVLERVGNISLPQDFTKQLYFSQEDANAADVNGGVLELAFSGVVLDVAPVASVVDGQVTAGLVVRNGGSLVLSGSDGSDSSTKLQLRGGMLVDGGTVSLGERTAIEMDQKFADATLALNDATVNLQADALLKAEVTTCAGTSTVTTAAPVLGDGPAGFRSPLLLQDSATVLNFRGSGDFFADYILGQTGGALNLEMEPDTGKLVTTGLVKGPLEINVGDGNLLEVQDLLDMRGNGSTELISISNDGLIRVGPLGDLRGAGVVTGVGSVAVETKGTLDARGFGGLSLLMDSQALILRFKSKLLVAIDPSAATSSALKVDELTLDNAAPGFAPNLILDVANDSALPVGQKLLLVDYASIKSGSGLPAYFAGLPEGFIFQEGLNQYQIRYSDSEYGASHGGNDSVITLTVVSDDQVGTTYCSPAVPNSSGQPGTIRAVGSDEVSQNDVTLVAEDLALNQFGYFLTSETQDFVANPGGSQGNLCLGGTIGRYVQQVQNSGATGSFSLALDLTDLPAPLKGGVQAGETWNFTTWFRDKNPSSTSNFTNAVSILFQ